MLSAAFLPYRTVCKPVCVCMCISVSLLFRGRKEKNWKESGMETPDLENRPSEGWTVAAQKREGR